MELILFRWVVNAISFLILSSFIPGFSVLSFGYALLASFFLGLVNALIRPILFILTLPINIVTLGLFTFVVNALMLLLVSNLTKGFSISGFFPALSVAVLMWFVGWFTNHLIDGAKRS